MERGAVCSRTAWVSLGTGSFTRMLVAGYSSVSDWLFVFLGVVLTAACLVSWMQGWTRAYWDLLTKLRKPS